MRVLEIGSGGDYYKPKRVTCLMGKKRKLHIIMKLAERIANKMKNYDAFVPAMLFKPVELRFILKVIK